MMIKHMFIYKAVIFNKIITNNSNVINIYVVYKLDPISLTRDTTFTIKNALFGAMEISKNADTSKYKYKGYGICFDEGDNFCIGNSNNGRNIVFFGADESSVVTQIIKLIIFM